MRWDDGQAESGKPAERTGRCRYLLSLSADGGMLYDLAGMSPRGSGCQVVTTQAGRT